MGLAEINAGPLFYYTENQWSAFYAINSMFMNCFYRNVLSESSSNEAFWLYLEDCESTLLYFFHHTHICRSYYLVHSYYFLKSVCTPSYNSCDCKKWCI